MKEISVHESELDLGTLDHLASAGVRSINVMPTMSFGDWLLMRQREEEILEEIRANKKGKEVNTKGCKKE